MKESAPAVSPDGRQLVFLAGTNGRFTLWDRPLDSPVSRELPGTEGLFGPFWSPDGRSIGFSTADELRRVDLATGTVRKICTLPKGAIFGGGGTWADDQGGEAKSLLNRPSGPWSVALPRIVGDRQRLYRVRGGEQEGLFVARLDAPDGARRLLPISSPGSTARERRPEW